MKKEMGDDVMYKTMQVTSTAFQHKEMIPMKYTCDGKAVNPPLHIDHIPEEAKCLALIVDDPDAPIGMFVHWVVWNIPITHEIKEDSIPGEEGMNDYKRQHWGEPCPPSGTHRYFFKVYALDVLLELSPTTTKEELEKAMAKHIVGFGELIGLYRRV